MKYTKKEIRLVLYNLTSLGFCPYCNKGFGKVTIDNVSDIDIHHVTRKSMTISRACAYGYYKALKEFQYGDCVWIHKDCHKTLHKRKGRGPCEVN